LQSDPQETVNVANKPEMASILSEHAELLKVRLAQPAPAGLKLLDPAAKASKRQAQGRPRGTLRQKGQER
jgi:hypothetical protein